MTDEVITPEVVDDDKGETFMLAASAGLLGIAFIIGSSLAVGIVTGFAASIGLGFLLWKTRRHCPKVWNTMLDHPVATDIGISGLFITCIAPMTLGGLVAGVSAGIFASAGIAAASKYVGKVNGIESYKIGMPKLKDQKVGFNV